jgi:hypothetical protein
MHRCQGLVRPTEQFWDWSCEMAFRAAVVLFLMTTKCLPFNISFIYGNGKRHGGGGVGPCEYEGVPAQLFVY